MLFILCVCVCVCLCLCVCVYIGVCVCVSVCVVCVHHNIYTHVYFQCSLPSSSARIIFDTSNTYIEIISLYRDSRFLHRTTPLYVASSIGRLLYVDSSEHPLVQILLPLPQECSIAVAAGKKAKLYMQVCACVCVFIFIYPYIHTHTYVTTDVMYSLPSSSSHL